MAYKTIGVIVTDPATDGPALKAAVATAIREGAHLDVHCIGIDPTYYEMVSIGTMAVVPQTAMVEAGEEAAALVTWASAIIPSELTQASVQPYVVSNIGLDMIVARLARYADMIVATQPYGAGRSPLQVAVVEAALFGTGAPVMIVPDATRDYGKPFGRVLVAWNEGEESLSAIRKALPMLRSAGQVDIVMVDPPSHSQERSDPGGAVCLMLARHGIRAEVSILAQTLPRVSDVLLRFANDHDCDAIVMGAYGHSRFRESILGGATREMLEHSTLPVFMAH